MEIAKLIKKFQTPVAKPCKNSCLVKKVFLLIFYMFIIYIYSDHSHGER